MAILVNELRDIVATPLILFFIFSSLTTYPLFWITINVIIISAIAYTTSTFNVRSGVEAIFAKFNSPPPYFLLQLSIWVHEWFMKVVETLDHVIYCLSLDLNAARNKLEYLPDVITNLAATKDKLATKDAEIKVAIAERDAAIARAGVTANEKQALMARIKQLESANGSLSEKLHMSEMNGACLEEQISMKTESQNEILEDMDKLEEELKATKAKLHQSEMVVKGLETELAVKAESQNEMLEDVNRLEHELKATKSEVADLKMQLHHSEMNAMSLEQQVAIKGESQNEILEDMDRLEDELKMAKGELKTAKAEMVGLEAKLRDRETNIASLEQQIVSQKEALGEADLTQGELKITKAKLQETAAQKAAMERDLVELRELAANQVAQTSAREASDKRIITQKTAEIAQLKEQLAEAIRTEPLLASEVTFHPGRPTTSSPVSRTPQLNTPPTSPRNSLLFGSAKVAFTKKANISPSSSKFGLSSIRIPSRRGSVGESPKKVSSVRRGRATASPDKTDKA